MFSRSKVLSESSGRPRAEIVQQWQQHEWHIAAPVPDALDVGRQLHRCSGQRLDTVVSLRIPPGLQQVPAGLLHLLRKQAGAPGLCDLEDPAYRVQECRTPLQRLVPDLPFGVLLESCPDVVQRDGQLVGDQEQRLPNRIDRAWHAAGVRESSHDQAVRLLTKDTGSLNRTV